MPIVVLGAEMSDNLPDAPPEKPAGLPEWIVDLKSIPGAVSAVAKLIGSFADAGAALSDIVTAAGQQKAQSIRDGTAGKSMLTKEAVRLLAKEMGKDPSLAMRAIEHSLGKAYAVQEAREAITLKALEQVRDTPPKEPPTRPPSDDWFNVFGDYAEKATSETLREHWAAILAGEIRKPGQFSFAALHLSSLLDQDAAHAIERIARTVVNGYFVPITPTYNDRASRYDDLLLLDGIGFLGLTNSSEEISSNGKEELEFDIAGKHYTFPSYPHANGPIHCGILTKAGRELLAVVKVEPDLDFVEAFRTALIPLGIVKPVPPPPPPLDAPSEVAATNIPGSPPEG